MSVSWSQLAQRYFAEHAINPDVAEAAQVRERDGKLIYPCVPREGDAFERERPLRSSRTYQPKDVPLAVWWPLGVPSNQEARYVFACEGESDALAALSVLASNNGNATARKILADAEPYVVAIPGTGMPVDHFVAELSAAGVVEVHLAFDGDEAGERYAAESHAALRAVGVRPFRITLPTGSDLAECLAAAEDPVWWLADALLESEAAAEAQAELAVDQDDALPTSSNGEISPVPAKKESSFADSWLISQDATADRDEHEPRLGQIPV